MNDKHQIFCCFPCKPTIFLVTKIFWALRRLSYWLALCGFSQLTLHAPPRMQIHLQPSCLSAHISSQCRMHILQIFFKYSTNILQMFYKYSTAFLQIFYKYIFSQCGMHILQIFYRYSKNIYLHDVVYILHKYSTSIIQI